MTQQVRAGYRRHRKSTWGLVIALVALVAAVVIPIASGAADKTYTLAFAAATQQNPTPSTTTTPICLGDGGTVTLYLTNTAKTASLGSAQIDVPTYVSGVTASKSTTGNPSAETPIASGTDLQWSAGNPVFLQNLGLGKYGYVKLVLTVPTAASAGTTPVDAIVKQSNNFNDTSGTANLFSDPSTWPTITIQSCDVTISGNVLRDNDGNGTGDSVPSQNHTVTLTGGSSPQTTSTDSNGNYSFTAAKNGSYTVCATANGGEVQTGPTSPAVCSGNTVGGYSLSNVTGNQTGKNFAFAGGVTASCGSDSTLQSQLDSGNASIKARITTYDSTCKAAGQQYVFTTYSDTSSRNAKLAPVVNPASTECKNNLSTGQGCQIVAEVITWSLTSNTPDTKTLTYDDTAQGGSSGTMQFCKKDPFVRTAGSDGLTLYSGSGYFPSDILPSGQSTCLARTTQYGPPGAATRIDEVYSAFDGRISLT